MHVVWTFQSQRGNIHVPRVALPKDGGNLVNFLIVATFLPFLFGFILSRYALKSATKSCVFCLWCFHPVQPKTHRKTLQGRCNFQGWCKFSVDIPSGCHGCLFFTQRRPGQNRVTWKTPSSRAFVPLQEQVGVLASSVPHAQMQVWSETSVVAQPLVRVGHDHGINKRVKTILIIIIKHNIIITTIIDLKPKGLK